MARRGSRALSNKRLEQANARWHTGRAFAAHPRRSPDSQSKARIVLGTRE